MLSELKQTYKLTNEGTKLSEEVNHSYLYMRFKSDSNDGDTFTKTFLINDFCRPLLIVCIIESETSL